MAREMVNSTEDFGKLRQLIGEVRKTGRECLYDLSHAAYKNNMVKQTIWGEIAQAMNMQKVQAQQLWKSTRQKYRLALLNSNSKNGSTLKPKIKFLMDEMEFIRKYIDQELTTTNSTTSSCRIASSSPTKRKCDDELAFENSCKQLQIYAEALTKGDEDIDPFFISLYKDVKTFPPLKQQELKITFMKAVYDAQKEQEQDLNFF